MSDPAPAFCLLPDRRFPCGPVTARRIARLCLIYLGLCAIGVAIAEQATSAAWKVFGLGLMLPGGGFLAHGDAHGPHLAVFLVIAGIFVASLLLWFATGNALAPPAVWLLAAIAAALMPHDALQPDAIRLVALVIAAAAGAALLVALLKWIRGAAQRRAGNRHLQTTGSETLNGFRGDSGSAKEFSPQDLKLMRFLLDRALQPLERFDGFEWLDQFQTAAVRYHLNFIGYALALAQATRLPALGGYLDEAQRRLIAKQTDRRIWRYWLLENLWGNLRADPDPVARENIMFTGFCATQIAMYQAASGCRDFDRPGSFSLRHPAGRSFDYDFGALIAALDRERKRSAFGLIACEPNWIYPLCNTIGAAAIKAHDRMSGNDRWSAQEAPFRRQLEREFIDLAGRFVPCRSVYSGFALPMIGGAQPQAMPSFFLNATMPDLAMRQWLLLRRALLQAGKPALARRSFWPVDTGNYRFSRASAYAGTAMAAVELGDRDVARLCLAALEQECPAVDHEDAFYRPNASVWAHAVELCARAGAKNGFRRLIEQPHDRAGQPVISEAPYPDVLFASAQHGQGALSAVLYPGAGSGRFRVRVRGLTPDGVYACDGTEQPRIRADNSGEAMVKVAMIGRTEIRIRPAA
jgi:Linalool dehydratase/isomerase